LYTYTHTRTHTLIYTYIYIHTVGTDAVRPWKNSTAILIRIESIEAALMVLIPVYYRKTVGKPETDPQLLGVAAVML
jgi:hypothetical protein